jgi:hypothetical protein
VVFVDCQVNLLAKKNDVFEIFELIYVAISHKTVIRTTVAKTSKLTCNIKFC